MIRRTGPLLTIPAAAQRYAVYQRANVITAQAEDRPAPEDAIRVYRGRMTTFNEVQVIYLASVMRCQVVFIESEESSVQSST